jgi:signal transduction histidine kinase
MFHRFVMLSSPFFAVLLRVAKALDPGTFGSWQVARDMQGAREFLNDTLDDAFGVSDKSGAREEGDWKQVALDLGLSLKENKVQTDNMLTTVSRMVWDPSLDTTIASAAVSEPYSSILEVVDVLRKDLQSTVRQREESSARLKRLTASAEQVEERERQRISEGLHDNVGQLLVAVKLKQGKAKRLVADGKESKEVIECLNETTKLLDTVLESVRSFSFELAPISLYEIGLAQSLNRLCEDKSRLLGVQGEFEYEGEDESIPEQLVLVLFRSASELLNNLAKHAKCMAFGMKLTQDEVFVTLTVWDNGVGFPTGFGEASHGLFTGKAMGLAMVTNRIELLGGQIVFPKLDSPGARVEIRVPML